MSLRGQSLSPTPRPSILKEEVMDPLTLFGLTVWFIIHADVIFNTPVC